MYKQPWDISKNIPNGQGGLSQYVGARYVPKLMGEWDANIKYDYLSQVTYFNSVYISRLPVPVGTAPTDSYYWMLLPYNDKINDIYDQIAATNINVDKNVQAIAALDAKESSDVAAINAELDQHGTEISQIKSDVNDNAGDIAKLDADLTSANAQISSNGNQIQALKQRMTTAEGDINEDRAQLNQINATLDGHEAQLTSLGTRMTAAENANTEQTQRLDTMDITLAGLSSSVDVHTTQIAQLFAQSIESIIDVSNPGNGLTPMTGVGDESSAFAAIAEYAHQHHAMILMPSASYTVNATFAYTTFIKGLFTHINGNWIAQSNIVVEDIIFADNTTLTAVGSIHMTDCDLYDVDISYYSTFNGCNIRGTLVQAVAQTRIIDTGINSVEITGGILRMSGGVLGPVQVKGNTTAELELSNVTINGGVTNELNSGATLLQMHGCVISKNIMLTALSIIVASSCNFTETANSMESASIEVATSNFNFINGFTFRGTTTLSSCRLMSVPKILNSVTAWYSSLILMGCYIRFTIWPTSGAGTYYALYGCYQTNNTELPTPPSFIKMV